MVMKNKMDVTLAVSPKIWVAEKLIIQMVGRSKYGYGPSMVALHPNISIGI